MVGDDVPQHQAEDLATDKGLLSVDIDMFLRAACNSKFTWFDIITPVAGTARP